MFFVSTIFWIIVGLGLAIPASLTIIINMATKMREGENYQFNLASLFWVYLVALVGWAIFVSEVSR